MLLNDFDAIPPVIHGQTAESVRLRFGDRDYSFWRIPDLDRLLDTITPEEWEHDERMPYWAEIWPSGLALAKILAEAPALAGTRILELGCGVGVASIVAARCGALVTATDFFPDALELLRVNAELNGVEIRRVELDWREPADIGRFDLVAAADVLYERGQTEMIVRMLGRTMTRDARAIVVDPERATARGFVDAAVYRGFRVTRHRWPDAPPKAPITVHDIVWG